MKVYIKNKLISLGGSSEVLNENQEPIYQVKGKWISITKKKKMYDMEDKLLYTIRNKYWTFFCDKVMVFDADGERVAIIKKSKWSWNCCKCVLIPISCITRWAVSATRSRKSGSASPLTR